MNRQLEREIRDALKAPAISVLVSTRVHRPRPTAHGVRGGRDYGAELSIEDESGVTHRWSGELTYAPDPWSGGEFRPYGGQIDHWMSSELVRALRTPWVSAHPRLVAEIVRSLGGGPGVEAFQVAL